MVKMTMTLDKESKSLRLVRRGRDKKAEEKGRREKREERQNYLPGQPVALAFLCEGAEQEKDQFLYAACYRFIYCKKGFCFSW